MQATERTTGIERGRSQDQALPRIAALLIAIALAGCASSSPTAVPTAAANLDPTGILLVGAGERVQSTPPSEAAAHAHSDAWLFAEANGADVGYPWIDPVTGELVLSAATPRGRQLLAMLTVAVPHRIRDVSHGFATLEQIKNDATLLRSRGVDGAELIFMTAPDHRDNRTLIVISKMSRPLLDYLASHYPPDALAIQVDPTLTGTAATGHVTSSVD